MSLENKRNVGTLLFNPFIYIAGFQALFLGLTAVLLAGLIGSFAHLHMDGVLDMHLGAPAKIWIYLLEGLIDWLSMGLVLLVLGRLVFRTPFRSIDLLGTQALARWPTVLMNLVGLLMPMSRFTTYLLRRLTTGVDVGFNLGDAIIFCAATLAILLLICWMVVLMYRSYTVSCNAKGAKAIWTFIVGLILAEALSKFTVLWMLKTY
ncbi:MAG: hypothetical protein WC378_01335 [Opitutaceae bacterium]|jgi:hypothetical protein